MNAGNAPFPCELCALKGGHNIQADGGCRHRFSPELVAEFAHAEQRLADRRARLDAARERVLTAHAETFRKLAEAEKVI